MAHSEKGNTMDQSVKDALAAPSQPKAPGFVLTSEKSGRKTILPAVKVEGFEEAIRAFKGTASVESQMSHAISVVVHLISGHPNEFKAKPEKDDKGAENAALRIVNEAETSMFGDKDHRGKLPASWSTVKSRYLAHYRKFGMDQPLWIERDGQKFAKPFRVVDTELSNEKEPTTPDATFRKALKLALGRGLKKETVESAIADLQSYLGALASGKVMQTAEGEEYDVIGEVVKKDTSKATAGEISGQQ